MTLALESVFPAEARAVGGELVRILATGVDANVEVSFGDVPAEVVALLRDGARTAIDVRAPACPPGLTEVRVGSVRLDGSVTGSSFLPFRFVRAPVAAESDLTRLVRALLRALRSQIILNTSTPVSLDYRESGSPVTPVAKVPSLTLIGPDVRENRFYGTNEPTERVVQGLHGLEVEILRPPITVDVLFVLEVVTGATADHLQLFSAVTSFFHQNPYLTLDRDGQDLSAGTVRFPLFQDGDARSARFEESGRTDDKKSFEWGLAIRGFPIDPDFRTDRTSATDAVRLRTELLTPTEVP